jgi:SAM-dependent methyltransferase
MPFQTMKDEKEVNDGRSKKDRVTMATNGVVVANCYDYPQYYDIAFQAYTEREADFIEAACRKYCPFDVRQLLEPACGSGRLVTELAARGYQMTGFDLSQRALSYLRRRLKRRRLHAETFQAEMSAFRLSRPVDAAYCTVNTFRHLLTEQAARNHLERIARSLRSGGIYVLGMHLLALDVNEEDIGRWTARRGDTKVTVALRILRTDVRRRIEDLRAWLLVLHGSKELQLTYDFQFRTYLPRQFRQLLDSVPSLELCDVYDFRYDIKQPFAVNDEMAYSVFVLRRLRGN